MAYKEGECFNCGKKIPVGCVCDKCAKLHEEDEAREAEAQENFEN